MLRSKQKSPKPKQNSKFKWINWAIIAVSIVAVMVYIFLVDKPENILRALRTIRMGWLLLAAGMMVVYWLLESEVLHIVVKKLYRRQHFYNTFKTSMVGQFYNCITPFASGGQPMQAYSMVKTGVPLGIAGSSLLVKFIVYQLTLTLYSLVMLVVFWGFFSSKVSGLIFLSAIGFAINFAVMAGLLCIGFARRFTQRAANAIIRFLARLHLIKKPEEKMKAAEAELERFYEGFQLARRNTAAVLQMFVLSAVQLTVFFLVPYFLCLAFGRGNVSPMQVIAAQAFVSMVTSFVPLPGAAGGAEISFVTFFAIFMTGSDLNLSMLLWRMLTFYFPILAGGLISIGCSGGKNAMQELEQEAIEETASE